MYELMYVKILVLIQGNIAQSGVGMGLLPPKSKRNINVYVYELRMQSINHQGIRTEQRNQARLFTLEDHSKLRK
jgi:hypothetical protein